MDIKTPWTVQLHGTRSWTHIEDVNGVCVCDMEEHTPGYRYDTAERIVKCVNACHDIEDPDRAHAVARDAIREAHALLSQSFPVSGPEPAASVVNLFVSQRLAHLSEAHALLGGGPL